MLEINHLTLDDDYSFGDAKLGRAAYHNDAPKVEKLLSQGVDVDEKNESDNRTALHYAAMNNVDESHYQVIEILLKNKAKMILRDIYERTPFLYLAVKGNANVVQLFLKFDANVHEVDKEGDSLLSYVACFNENVEVVPLLTGLGLDVNHKGNYGKTPLHCMCYSNADNLKMLKCLLKNGADMNSVENEQITPLLTVIERVFSANKSDKNLMKESFMYMIEHTDFNSTAYRIMIDLMTIVYVYDVNHLWKMVLEHLAKLQVLNVPMHSTVSNSLSKYDKFSKYFKKCQKELSEAKNTKLTNSWVSYYNLLMDSKRKLKNYAGNKSLIEDFGKSNCPKKFPIFGPAMIKIVKKGIKRR